MMIRPYPTTKEDNSIIVVRGLISYFHTIQYTFLPKGKIDKYPFRNLIF